MWGISCEKSRFYAKKSYFFQFWGGVGGNAPGASPSPGSTSVLGVNCANKELLLLFYLRTNNKSNNNSDVSCFIYCVCKSCYNIILYTLYYTCAHFILVLNNNIRGPGGSMSLVVGLPNSSYNSITNTAWVRARLCNLQRGALDSQRK